MEMSYSVGVRRAVLVIILALALAGCGVREVREIELDDGTRCAVTHNNISGNESEPHCDWDRDGDFAG